MLSFYVVYLISTYQAANYGMAVDEAAVSVDVRLEDMRRQGLMTRLGKQSPLILSLGLAAVSKIIRCV